MFPTKPQESYSQPGYKLQEIPLQTPGQQVAEQQKEQPTMRGGDGGCFKACMACLCCCFVAEEGVDTCINCGDCLEGV
ncbi:hypothetical protein BDZ45DRAFT_675689 [Acephala macrosclerotiorum]|nr:hypothetical protein BDZ45DRAFT_675689 [Acephala macrosclerotiorum]